MSGRLSNEGRTLKVEGRRSKVESCSSKVERHWSYLRIRSAGIIPLLVALVVMSLGGSNHCRADPPSFRNDVLPVFSKVGCNSGACHGALAGKGGFRLSLRGYDPESDYFSLTRQAQGRRIELSDPGRSLFLMKPTGVLPHKGGVRIETDSDAYRILVDWLRHGAPGPRSTDSRVERVDIEPAELLVASGTSQDLSVIATFDDGSTRDVTSWARFASTDESVARVDETGRIDVVGPGGAAITAWYSSKIGIARVASPYPNQVAAAAYETAESRNFIDELVLQQLRRLNLPPSPPADDAVFVRRVFLDTTGTLPTADEVQSYLEDVAPDRRSRLIDSLLQRPEFVDYWSYQFSDLLLINGSRLRPAAVKAFYEWIRGEVQKNTPWDDFVRSLLTASGSSVEHGATNFYALHQDPESMAENASQAFLGLSVGCAKCHNHPLEKWTNDQYYAFANLFSRVRAKGWGGERRKGDGKRTVFLANDGELVQPIRGKPQPPTPLDGEPIPFDFGSVTVVSRSPTG